ncbi:MAG: secondary thiamine-phosphate synthase enzyme YjbQ [Bdellovibrionales bacterium]|nr:secondary thiamine-phosphate synthase enzyme YjbQ [Bdellovibrionales bacterium]
MIFSEELQIVTKHQGLLEITRKVRDAVTNSCVQNGLCTVFVRHTSASLIIQENADPSAKRDLEYFLNKLIPENDSGFTHTFEGPDDMPSHIKAALTQTSVVIPVVSGEMTLGTWQGIYLWEHRASPHSRTIVVHCMGED